MNNDKWLDSVGPGWHTVIKDTIPLIEAKGGFIMQVKEKFGGLRIYSHGGDYDAIEDVVREAERKCGALCEVCGGAGTLINNDGWMKTLCKDCSK